jgi:hypothetical protein
VSDYLSTLAARVVGVRGSMQPRVASRFEAAESWGQLPAAGFQPASFGERVPAESLLSDRHDANPTFPSERAETETVDATRDTRTPHVHAGQPAAAGEQPAAMRRAEKAAHKAAHARSAAERASSGDAHEPAADIGEGTVRPASAGDPTSLLTPSPREGAPATNPRAPATTTEGEASPRTPIVPRTRAVVRNQGLATAIERLRARREPAGGDREAAPAPIEITIGRIDIRAVVAPPPQRSKAKPGPRLTTLEEYAAKRSGGSR